LGKEYSIAFFKKKLEEKNQRKVVV
jgi:hypothetical protein